MLTLEIITPQKTIYKEEVDEVIIPTISGQITILPNHVPLLSRITEGEITIKKTQKSEFLAITGGFLEVSKDKVMILADYAIRSHEIEVSKAIEAQKRAERLMQEAKDKQNEKDFVFAEGELRKALLEIKIAHKQKTRPTPLKD